MKIKELRNILKHKTYNLKNSINIIWWFLTNAGYNWNLKYMYIIIK